MTALLKTTQIQEPSSATINLALDTSGGVTVGQNLTVTGTTTLSGSLSGSAVLSAGTTSIAPLRFTSGTNLTSATAGALEYDGKVPYITPQSTERGVIPGAQFFRLNSSLGGANSTSAQSVFGVGVTLSGSTVYAFEAVYPLSKSAGTTSHTIGLGFGGTATINNIGYSIVSMLAVNAFTTVGTAQDFNLYFQTASNTTATNAETTASRAYVFIIKGTVSINAGGTFIPQYTLSAAPGGAYTTAAGAYFMIYPISASGANTSVGTWA